MAMKYFEATTSDKDILKQDILRTLIYRKAEKMLVGANACQMMNVQSLDSSLIWPKTTMITPSRLRRCSRLTA